MITVPACFECNQNKKLHDEYLRDYLITNPAAARHPVAWKLLLTKFHSAVHGHHSVFGRAIAKASVEPYFTPAGIYLGLQPVAEVDMEAVSFAIDFIVRGLFYKEAQIPLSQHVVPKLKMVDSLDLAEARRLRLGQPHREPITKGQGVFEYIVVLDNDRLESSSWLMWFYEAVGFSVEIQPAPVDAGSTSTIR